MINNNYRKFYFDGNIKIKLSTLVFYVEIKLIKLNLLYLVNLK